MGDNETYISSGGEYSRLIEKQTVLGVPVQTNLNSIGIYVDSFVHKPNESIGYFLHESVLLPLGGSIEAMGSSLEYTLKDTEFKIQMSLMMGPAFKKAFNDDMELYFGTGPGSIITSFNDNYNASFILQFGLGADCGIRYFYNNKYFVNFGLAAEYDFIGFSLINGEEKWTTSNYSAISLKPHIGFGMKYGIRYVY